MRRYAAVLLVAAVVGLWLGVALNYFHPKRQVRVAPEFLELKRELLRLAR